MAGLRERFFPATLGAILSFSMTRRSRYLKILCLDYIHQIIYDRMIHSFAYIKKSKSHLRMQEKSPC